MITELKDTTFNVKSLSGKVIIDFWAPWCGPCKMSKPKFEEYANKYLDINFCTVNVDECPQLASIYKISNVPTFVVIYNGEEVKRVYNVIDLLDFLG